MESLRSGREIRQVRATRQRAASDAMVLHVRRARPGQDRRVAVVAGRAVGSAVRRNRAKRRLRAAVRAADLPPVDVVIDARRAALRQPFTTLRRDLERLADRALGRER